MKGKKHLIMFVSLVLAAAMLVSCSKKSDTAASGAQSQNAASDGQSIVRIGIAADPGTLSPFAPMSQGGIATRRSIYEFIIDRDKFGGDMVGSLMESWKRVDDVTYELTLYNYIVDTAGNKLTASDVKFSYDTAKGTGNLPKLSIIKSIDLIDTYSLRFVFNAPLAVGELEGIWSECPVVTEASYNASPDKMAASPVGTTAYKVTEYSTASKIILKKTGSYWQTDVSKMPLVSQSNVDTIEFHIIPEAAQMVIAMETGAIDITNEIKQPTQVKRFSSTPANYNVFRYLNNPVVVLLMNFSANKAFGNNPALRQAIAYAIDTAGISEGVYGSDGKALKTVGTEKYGDFNAKWSNEPYYEYDLAKAKALMAEAGYPSGGLTLRLLCQNTEELQNIAAIVQGDLGEIGITVTINPYEVAMLRSLEADPTAWDMELNTYGSTDYLVNLWKLSLSAGNYNGRTVNFVVDSKLQALLDKSLSVEGHTTANVDELHYYIKDNLLIYGLTINYGSIVATKKITNVLLDSRNSIMPGGSSYSF
jgi:ABC-type transport system substrate-binding protein